MPNCPRCWKPGCVWYPFATHRPGGRWRNWLGAVARVRCRPVPGAARSRCTLLDEMRLIEDAHELDMYAAPVVAPRPRIRDAQLPTCCGPGKDVREYHLDELRQALLKRRAVTR